MTTWTPTTYAANTWTAATYAAITWTAATYAAIVWTLASAVTTIWNQLSPIGFGLSPFGDPSNMDAGLRIHQRGFGDPTTQWTPA